MMTTAFWPVCVVCVTDARNNWSGGALSQGRITQLTRNRSTIPKYLRLPTCPRNRVTSFGTAASGERGRAGMRSSEPLSHSEISVVFWRVSRATGSWDNWSLVGCLRVAFARRRHRRRLLLKHKSSRCCRKLRAAGNPLRAQTRPPSSSRRFVFATQDVLSFVLSKVASASS